ncbi:MAG: redox-sensing transcriptional repressor Rex [Trueperaceae bacterium]|nr:redox-sensing transcriptional repressor Rex [Trueperaceae bacterium]
MASIPTATVSRLVSYLRILSQLDEAEVTKTSSEHLAAEAHVSAFQVRKDLAYFGKFGTRGTGYTVQSLRDELKQILGLTRPWNVAIVGMGRLGEALAVYPNLARYDFRLASAFDVDPAKVGREIGGIRVRHVDDIPTAVGDLEIEIALLTVPTDAAQAAADALAAAGVAGILNFAPTVIDAPPGAHVEPVDFLAGLKRLSFYIQRSKTKEATT